MESITFEKVMAVMLAVAIYPEISGGQSRDRTGDTRIFSPVLYQLSYLPNFALRYVTAAKLLFTL